MLPRRLCFLIAFLGTATAFAQSGNQEPSSAQLEFFEKRVRPVLANNCWKCHGPDEQEGGLRLDSRRSILAGGDTGPAVVPAKPDESELITAVNYSADGYQMPPTGKLEAEAIAALTEWVAMGAPWPGEDSQPAGEGNGGGIDLQARARHWSFQPITQPVPPKVADHGRVRSPIDRFILSRLESEGLQPAAEADRRTLLRRVTFDLIGLPPHPSEIRRFLDDSTPGAYERAVDRLLSSPRYGERWGRHWLDLVRFAETGGHEFDYDIAHAWQYRDYVIRAFNADVPYDQLTIEHIAGDLVEAPRREPVSDRNESVIGTGFYWFGQGKHSPVDLRAEECDCVDNQLDVLGKTFLGLTIACARCHDHKFDAITTRDYYALAGFLQSSRQQWADINPQAETHRKVESLIKLGKRSQNSIAEHLEQVRVLPDKETADAWHEQLQEAADDAHSFWDPWRVLAAVKDPQEFAKHRNEMLRATRDQQQVIADNLKDAVVFEDFEDGSYDGWTNFSFAFGTAPTRAGELILDSSVDAPAARFLAGGLAHSGRISGRLQGTLRSETFTIDKRYIHYRAARTAGKKSPGRQLKNGQISLIVDGFQYIRNPLYGHFTINLPNDGQVRWHTQNLGKFLGKRAYIEVEDADDGWISLDRILFSDHPPPPEAPNPAALSLLGNESIDSPIALAAAYRDLLQTSLTSLGSSVLGSSRASDLKVDVLNWLLRPNSLVPTDTTAAIEKTIVACHQDRERIEHTIPQPVRALAMVDGTSENEHVLIRGNHRKPGDQVERRFLEVFAGVDEQPVSNGSRRLELAHQIVDPDNPLAARVLVNRLWHYHFGRGLVASVDNFGRLGETPTHPELLDFLAAEFLRSGWSIKHMQRMMVLSATYRMSSAMNDETAERTDPQNKLLHRMSVRRLEGEIIRDSILALSGRLDRKMYGRSIMPHLSEFMEGRGRPGRSGPLDGDGRASIYINVRRNFLTPMFLAFDYPTPFTTVGKRSVSNVPAQALTLMNNPFILLQARVWAEQLIGDTEPDAGKRIQQAYESALGRPPTDGELAGAREFIASQAAVFDGPDDPRTWTDFCHVLMNVKEFVFVH